MSDEKKTYAGGAESRSCLKNSRIVTDVTTCSIYSCCWPSSKDTPAQPTSFTATHVLHSHTPAHSKSVPQTKWSKTTHFEILEPLQPSRHVVIGDAEVMGNQSAQVERLGWRAEESLVSSRCMLKHVWSTGANRFLDQSEISACTYIFICQLIYS